MDDHLARLMSLSQLVTRTADQRDAEALQAQAVAFQQAIQERHAAASTAHDTAGLIRATVQADGIVQSVYVSPQALRLDTGALGAACVEAVNAARAAAATELAQWLAGAAADPGRSQ